eukprot:TRINITY_DN3910_c2_g1_i1.p1 TRINITY_DN3910_c2_g1~~TRINITY_DN3910_c2_g1_i1.p1  ORF type:complete len:719 (+),score=167.71 TRINITY_DN3910_c2_g1_i1:92-2248(+)
MFYYILFAAIAFVASTCAGFYLGLRMYQKTGELHTDDALIPQLQRRIDDLESQLKKSAEVMAVLSHEIRTPMNAVVAMTNMLLDTTLTSEQHEYASIIRTSGSALLAIINSVLDFARIGSQNFNLNNEEFNLEDCLYESMELGGAHAAPKQVDLAVVLQPDLPRFVVSDPARLRQILINLIGNAVKFTSRGEVVVSCSVFHPAEFPNAPLPTVLTDDSDTRSGASLQLHFSIRDTGIGVDAEHQAKMFDPFYLVQTEAARQGSGTGLGLPISQALSALMGGSIWVESAGEGCGTTMHFTIRVCLRDESAPQLESKQLAVPQMLAGRKILIVDDNVTCANMVAHHAQALGMTTFVANNREQTLQILAEGTAEVDAVVVDVQLEECTGAELIHDIHALPRYQRVPVMLMVYKHTPSSEPRYWDGESLKPIKREQLQRVLCDILHIRMQQPSVTSAPSPQPSSALRILLAEDNVVNQRIATLLLSRLGHTFVHIVDTGSAAVTQATQSVYDVVLMDVQMPVLNGMDATRAIRSYFQQQQQRGPWVVMMTANVLPEQIAEYLAAGADAHVGKPCSLEQLSDAIQPRHVTQHVQLLNVATEASAAVSAPQRGSCDNETLALLQDAGALGEVVDAFTVQSEEYLRRAQVSVAAHDSAALHSAMHGLRGSSGNLGAVQLASCARQVEQLASEDGWEKADARHLLEALWAERDRVVSTLREFASRS